MRHFILLLIIFIFTIPAQSQEEKDKPLGLIKVEEVKRNTYIYSQYGYELEFKVIRDRVSIFPESEKEIRSAAANVYVGNTFIYTGSFLIGYFMGRALRNSDPSFLLLGAGGMSCVIGVIFLTQANRKTAKAVSLYNKRLWHEHQKKTSQYFQHKEISLGLCSNGIGVQLSF